MISRPVSVYINWAAYDELSDAVELTETLALKQLDELLRLRKAGVRLDYYLMDAFWYDPKGAYRTWRKPHWPQGPDKWLKTCLQNGVKPGLWFSGNTLCKLEVASEWKDSFDPNINGLCLFHGGFLNHWLETIRFWYERGVRLIKLDFMHFGAAPDIVRQNHLPSEIRTLNIEALRHGLGVLREACPDLLILGYNGFEETETQNRTDIPFRKTVDPHWLDTFDSLYCGDPRPADVPAMNFWRAKDVYTDHMVRVYQKNGFPLSRIDNAGFMIGTTGTCYFRKTAAWQGMLILSLARGGWVNTYYGNLDLLSHEQGVWFAKVQSLFQGLQAYGRFSTFGGMPGESQPYGYVAEGADGTLFTVVNPAQAVGTIRLPAPAGGLDGRILFQDSGYVSTLCDGTVKVGPEQLVVIGTGCYKDIDLTLTQPDSIRIPSSIQPLAVEFKATGNKELTATLSVPREGCVRIVLRQANPAGNACRTTGGCPPNGIPLGKLVGIEVHQAGKPIALQINYDKAIWSGLSWAIVEFKADALQHGVPVQVRCFSQEPSDVVLKAEIYHTIYSN